MKHEHLPEPVPALQVEVAVAAEEKTEGDETNPQWTIDELAADSGVPSRTIRFYQSKGLLPKPVKRGRVAYYSQQHVERLKHIATLQDRGLRISAIRALMARVDKGEVDVGEWLGIQQQLAAPWAGDSSRTVSESELFSLAGRHRAGLIGDLMRLEIIERKGEVYLVRSPALLKIAMRLEEAGVDLDTTVRGEQVLRKHLQRAATGLAKLFVDEALNGNVASPQDGDWGAFLSAMRPTSSEAVQVVFGQEMERALRGIVDSGRLAKLPRKRRRRKARAKKQDG